MTQYSIERDMDSLDISSSPSPHEESTDNHKVRLQASDMHQRARLLLDELVHFQQYLDEIKKEDTLYLKSFKSDVQQELKLLEKVM